MRQKNKIEKINIGYLIPAWAELKQGFFREQLLTGYQTEEFQLFCYVDDHNKAQFSPYYDGISQWREIAGLKASLVAQTIINDKIDILVNLAGTKRLGFIEILARKPAALQLCFVGEYNTTGLSTVDYLLTDKYCDPLDQTADYFTESLWHLPQTHFCYTPPEPERKVPAAAWQGNDCITFGSFYRFTKLSDQFLALWGEILTGVPKARLRLKSRIFGSGFACQETRFRLNRLGFPAERVDLIASSTAQFTEYEKVDIILDTYPKQGMSSTCDALYMGVPVICLVGRRHSWRLGYSLLKNLGLDECIAFNEREYVNKAIMLATNQYKLLQLHNSLRTRLSKSSLLDAKRYVSNIERTYRKIWQTRLNEKNQRRLKLELTLLLQTLMEGLVYVHGKLAIVDCSQQVRQIIIVDMPDALHNIQVALGEIESLVNCLPIVAALHQQARLVNKLYGRGEYGKVCELINRELMPGLQKLALVFAD